MHNMIPIDTMMSEPLKANQAARLQNFFMLNLAEHEIVSANKYENAKNRWHFSYLLT